MKSFRRVPSKSYNKTDYYVEKSTGLSQWPNTTFKDEKSPLPSGWIRLNSKGECLYIFKSPQNISSLYSPEDEDQEKKIIMSTYESLAESKDPRARKEIHRRNDLLLLVANLLGVEYSSIGDESIEYLSEKYGKSLVTIIAKIKELQEEQLGVEKCELTAFTTIQTDITYKSERSIRELLDLNMREKEAAEALDQINNLVCPIDLDGQLMKDPVMCSSGHTFERSNIERSLRDSKVCPITRIPISTELTPNYFARKIIDAFVEKYKHQKGELWKGIREICESQIEFVRVNPRQNSKDNTSRAEQTDEFSDMGQIIQLLTRERHNREQQASEYNSLRARQPPPLPIESANRIENQRSNSPETQKTDQYLEQMIRNTEPFIDPIPPRRPSPPRPPRPRPQIFTLPVENQRSNSTAPETQTTDQYLEQLIRNTEPFIDPPTLPVDIEEPQPLQDPFTSEYSPKILDDPRIPKTNQYSENFIRNTEPFTNKYTTTNVENRQSPTRQRSRSPTRRNQYPDQTIINVPTLPVDREEIQPLRDPFTREYSLKNIDNRLIPKPFNSEYSPTNVENQPSPTRQRSRSPTRRNQYPDQTIINV